MEKINKSSERINHIKYNTNIFSPDCVEYFSFDARWKENGLVSFKIKNIIDGCIVRNVYCKKGQLNFDSSNYFISLVDSINFKELKKECINNKIIVCDGENNVLKVKTGRYSGRMSWYTDAFLSKYIDDIKTLVRICKRHKEKKITLSIE